MSVYDAFISYSHAKDRPIANALQSVIQRLGKPWYRRRELRVFRDDTSLSATPQLWPTIVQALDQSRFLILLASPEAAASRWVDKEAQHWLAHKSANTFLIALTDGDLAWDDAAGDFAWPIATPLPPSLKGHFSNEPKWVDLRAYRAGANPRDQAFMELAADFAAAVRGIPKEDLLSEELRQQRRALRLAWSAAGAMLVLAAGVGWQWWEATTQRDRALNALKGAQIAQSFGFDMVVGGRPDAGFPIELISGVLERARSMQQGVKSQEMLPDLRRLEAMALRELGTTRLFRGEAQAALAAATQSKQIMDDLLAIDPANSVWQRELSISHNRIGEALARNGQHKGALASFRAGLDLLEKVPAQADANAQPRDGADAQERNRDRAIGYERIADALFADDKLDQARVHYETSLEIRQGLAGSDPTKTQWQGDLAVSYDRIARLAELDNIEDAEVAYREALEIRKKLVTEEPRNTSWQRDLAVSHGNMGALLLKTGRPDQGIASYRMSLGIREALARSYPDDVRWQTDIASSLVSLAQAGDERRQRYARALEILRQLDGKLDASQSRWAADIERQLRRLPP